MSPVCIFVVDVPEFRPVVEAARSAPGATIAGPRAGYWRIESATELLFERKPMGLKPALWWSLLTGGFDGHIACYTRDELRLVGANR